MSEANVKTVADFVLPPRVVTKRDLSRLVSEFEQIDNQLTSAAARAKAGVKDAAELVLSPRLTDFLNLNKLKPSTAQQRAQLIEQLHKLKDAAPVLHMTFAVEADEQSLGQLAQWVRTSLHPQAVIEVGLQPALVAGVYLRTPNHIHDLSIRSLLGGQRAALRAELEALRAVK